MSKGAARKDGSDSHPNGRSRTRRAAVEAALVEGQRRFLGFLIGRLGNADDAKDVFQDFALRAIRRSNDLRDVASVRGWLSRLLATAVADHHRRISRRRGREVPADPWSEEAAGAALPDDEADAAVCACLKDVIDLLPPAAADLLRRVDLRGQSRSEVARDLTISEGALAVRLHRARKKLRDLLVDLCLTCPEHGFLDCACDRALARRHAAANPAPGARM